MIERPAPQPQRTPPKLTSDPLGTQGLAPVLDRNIRALQQRRAREAAHMAWSDRLAQAVTAFCGSLAFVAVHAAIVAAWIAVNLGALPGAPRFDRSFVILATAASVEAIFLSTFVLISQNRAAAEADRRADLDLQMNLLTEHEVTRLVTLVRAVAAKLGVAEAQDADLDEYARDVAPETVMDGLDEARRREGG